MDTLRRHLSSSGQVGVQGLKKIATRFEGKNYLAATSQNQQSRKINRKQSGITRKKRQENGMNSQLQSVNVPSSMHKGAMGSMQQTSVSAPQQESIKSFPPQTGANLLHSSLNPLLPNSTLTEVGTAVQSTNSPFAPNMSTPSALSPMPGDFDKPNTAISSTSNAAAIVIQQQIGGVPASSLGTPGISASPLAAELSPPDCHGTTMNSLSGKSGVTDRPLQRLLKVVESMSSEALKSAVGDIVSVVSMIDQIAAPGNGSTAAVGEDLVAMTKCRLRARNFITRDGSSGTKRMRRYINAMPLNVASSVGSLNNRSMTDLSWSQLQHLV